MADTKINNVYWNEQLKKEKDKLRKELTEINDADLTKIFSTNLTYVILQSPMNEIKDALNLYKSSLDLDIGDIIVMNDKKYFITCFYTDYSYDLRDEQGNYKNCGLYMRNYKKISKMEIINE